MTRSSPFELSDRYVDESAALDPTLATSLGLPGYDHLWGDSLGLDGHAARMHLVRRYRTTFAEHESHPDPKQRLAARVMLGALDEEIEADAAGEHFRDLGHLVSSFQTITYTLGLMRTDSDDGWRALLSRLETIDQPYALVRERLAEGRRRGFHVPRRQVASVIDQARTLAGGDSVFDQLVRAGKDGSPSLAPRFEAALERARSAVLSFAEHLEQDVLPWAPLADGVGEERYRLLLARATSIAIDPHEAYAWGWDELFRLREAMGRVASAIAPGTSLDEVTHLLETDESRAATSAEALLDFVAQRLSEARERLTGVHFDVDPRLSELRVELAPPGTPLGAYYHSPSEDFSRPGSIRYAVGDQRTFPLYHQVSTAYHEGFPGHHLQIGTAMTRADALCRAHRLMVWNSGYGEGWAMYTERLMGELGFFEKPDYELGMLAKQLYRAARVVVDVGLHLGLEIHPSSPFEPKQPWTFERAVEFMRIFGHRTPAQADNEVKRYLGWPGQAPTYKLGERELLRLREDARERLRGAFSLGEFHQRVIGNGAMRLDLLRELVLDDWTG